LINVSPGSPAMNAVWIVLAEVGGIAEPFEIVQTLRFSDRAPGGSPIAPAHIGLDNIYKRFHGIGPAPTDPTDSPSIWRFDKAKSQALRDVAKKARLFGQVNEPVLILGERGTGKTTLANWMRANSSFCNRELGEKWPTTHCGLFLNDQLLQSELFGHTKGAFTGAKEKKDGILKMVDGDTLFLDEIGDLRPTMQRLLIRAVESGRFTPVGATKDEVSRFRLISATNKSWEVLQDSIEQDFLDRISVLMLEMPPLREITEDLDWLWKGIFESKVSDAMRGRVSDKDHTFIVDQLAAKTLKGNLRDLQRVAVHLNIRLISSSDPITRSEIEAALQSASGRRASSGYEDISRAVAAAFVNGHRMDEVLERFGMIETATVLTKLQGYMAGELQHLIHPTNRIEEISDLKPRTAYKWIEKSREIG